jgi:DNA-binding MarR family transcriptional regulator
MAAGDRALGRAQAILAIRRARDAAFDEDLFGDPVWTMLLELFVSAEQGRALSTTAACAAAGTPAVTALRWIEVLVRRGLVRRWTDADDGRRTFLVLAPPQRERMRALLLEAGGLDA